MVALLACVSFAAFQGTVVPAIYSLITCPAPGAARHDEERLASASALATPAGPAAHAGAASRRAVDAGPHDAWYYLNQQLGFGPRNPGSPGHRKMIDFLVSELTKYADEVTAREFEVRYEGRNYAMANVAALFRSANGDKTPFIILGAHFDTRPRAELDPDPAKRALPIMGANDGASGVAVLLEIAGILAGKRPPIPLMLAFFDGEDFGPTADSMFLGSRRFAQEVDPSSVKCIILLDMVGDADLDIYIEGNSRRSSPALVSAVWESALRLGYGHVFHNEVLHYILDDHVPFIERGIPAVDIIDFSYPYWHTTLDTADKCSPESLRMVRDVVLHVVFDGDLLKSPTR